MLATALDLFWTISTEVENLSSNLAACISYPQEVLCDILSEWLEFWNEGRLNMTFLKEVVEKCVYKYFKKPTQAGFSLNKVFHVVCFSGLFLCLLFFLMKEMPFLPLGFAVSSVILTVLMRLGFFYK